MNKIFNKKIIQKKIKIHGLFKFLCTFGVYLNEAPSFYNYCKLYSKFNKRTLLFDIL